MNTPAPRLTARDLIAKSFSAKSRRGYDPAEVDAYLMDVARQVDELNLEIDRLTNEVVRLSFAATPTPVPTALPVAVAAPPPPPVAPPAPMVVERIVEVPAKQSADIEESFQLVLRAAQKTAEQAITDARAHGEEIVAEARFRAAEVNREADRKAFEAASRTQEEVVRLEEEVKRKRYELDSVKRALESERSNVRELADSLLEVIGEKKQLPAAPPSNGVVDLTSADNRPAPALTPAPPVPAAPPAPALSSPPPAPASFDQFRPFGED